MSLWICLNKNRWIIVFLLLFFSCFTVRVFAEEGYSDDFRYSVIPEESLLSESTDLNDPNSIAHDLRPEHWLSYLFNQLKQAFDEAIGTLIKGISFVLLSVIVNRFCSNIQSQNIQLIFSLMVSLSIVMLCEENLRTAAEALNKGIEDMGIFTTACIPSFTVVMIASGDSCAASVFSATMVLLGEIGTIVSKNLLMPLTNVYLAIGVCSAVSDEYNFSSIGKNIRKFLIWAMGLFIVGFRMIMKLQNSVASAGDLIAKKYIKSAVGSFMPIIGNTLSQGVDGLFAVASGVKTSFSIAGVLIVLSIILPILIPIGVNGLIWNFCKWIAEFMNDKTIKSIAEILANSFYLMLALGGCVALAGLFSFFGLITQVS